MCLAPINRFIFWMTLFEISVSWILGFCPLTKNNRLLKNGSNDVFLSKSETTLLMVSWLFCNSLFTKLIWLSNKSDKGTKRSLPNLEFLISLIDFNLANNLAESFPFKMNGFRQITFEEVNNLDEFSQKSFKMNGWCKEILAMK